MKGRAKEGKGYEMATGGQEKQTRKCRRDQGVHVRKWTRDSGENGQGKLNGKNNGLWAKKG